jgi:hypothetical protein
MHSFVLRRLGTVGDVGEGCEFTNGQTVICWRGHYPHLDIWTTFADAQAEFPVDVELVWKDQ